MARAIDWTRYDELKAQGHSECEIAGALRRELQKRQGPPAPVQTPVQTTDTDAVQSVGIGAVQVLTAEGAGGRSPPSP